MQYCRCAIIICVYLWIYTGLYCTQFWLPSPMFVKSAPPIHNNSHNKLLVWSSWIIFMLNKMNKSPFDGNQSKIRHIILNIPESKGRSIEEVKHNAARSHIIMIRRWNYGRSMTGLVDNTNCPTQPKFLHKLFYYLYL